MRIEHSTYIELKNKYDKVIKFLKDIPNCSECAGIRYEAQDLLKDLGENNDRQRET